MPSQQTMLAKLRALPKSRGVKISSDNSVAFMICQWHYREGKERENTPSFKINLTKSGEHATGTGHCFACSKHVNKFEVIIDPSKEGKEVETEDEKDVYTEQLYDERTNQLLQDDDVQEIIFPNAIPWSQAENWRSIKGKLLCMLGAKLIFDTDHQNLMAYLPCVVNKVHIGGIKANLEKKGKRNYFNTSGSWVKNNGLFPYDFTRRMIKKLNLDTIVIVEGPRDSLRSLQYGIPAVGILGTGNWSDMKSELIANLGVNRVITALDGDEAGRRATKKIYESFRGEFDVHNFNFSKYGEGIDPGNANSKIMKKLRGYTI